MTESAAPPDIRPATALLSSALPSAPAGFAPLWFRHQRIGAIGPQWLTGLDPQLFRIEDDGLGMDEPSVSMLVTLAKGLAPTNHFGLDIMQSRAKRLGGSLIVAPNDGGGTRVQLLLPMAQAQAGVGGP